MTALEIVHILKPYNEYVIKLQNQESERQPQYEYSYDVSLSYTFLTLKVLRKTTDGTNKSVCIQITFRIENNIIVLSDFFHADSIDTAIVTEEIKSNTSLHHVLFALPEKSTTQLLNETINSLSIADRISNHAVNMHTGDNYWPGNYSSVILTADGITLEQINHMNSRSLNHKDNYSLRDLVFQIHIQPAVTFKQSFGDVLLGNMLISFSDHSSQNNRAAGDAIQEQLKKEF